MSMQRITWNCTQSGQKRAYADTTTEGVLTIEKDFLNQGFEPWDNVGEAHAKRLAKSFVSWVDEPCDWFEPRLTEFHEVGPGQYFIQTTTRYND